MVIGVHCATQPQRTGLAFGQFTQDELVIREVRRATHDKLAHLIVKEWIQGSKQMLHCLDAPLGWPAALGQSLLHHRAGAAMAATTNALFVRMTDHPSNPAGLGLPKLDPVVMCRLRILSSKHALPRVGHRTIRGT
jgi:hypothetical protein